MQMIQPSVFELVDTRARQINYCSEWMEEKRCCWCCLLTLCRLLYFDYIIMPKKAQNGTMMTCWICPNRSDQQWSYKRCRTEWIRRRIKLDVVVHCYHCKLAYGSDFCVIVANNRVTNEWLSIEQRAERKKGKRNFIKLLNGLRV